MSDQPMKVNVSGFMLRDRLNPTPEDLSDPLFDAIWQTIKRWDIQRMSGEGYAGANGSDVMEILSAVRAVQANALAQAEARVAAVRAALVVTPTYSCRCSRCLAAKVEHMPFTCPDCGYVGEPLVLPCECYDDVCPGGSRAGIGCPHGSIVCPFCGDDDVDLLAVVKQIRAALDGQQDGGRDATD